MNSSVGWSAGRDPGRRGEVGSERLQAVRCRVPKMTQTGFLQAVEDVLDGACAKVSGLSRLRLRPAQHVGIARGGPGRSVPCGPQVDVATGEGLVQALRVGDRETLRQRRTAGRQDAMDEPAGDLLVVERAHAWAQVVFGQSRPRPALEHGQHRHRRAPAAGAQCRADPSAYTTLRSVAVASAAARGSGRRSGRSTRTPAARSTSSRYDSPAKRASMPARET